MAATRFLSARPIPVIDCLICSAENSVTSILPANSVAKITPRASPTESDVLALTLEKTRSTQAKDGRQRRITSPNSSAIRRRRKTCASRGKVWMMPLAKWRFCALTTSMTPQPVFANPGSMPRIKMSLPPQKWRWCEFVAYHPNLPVRPVIFAFVLLLLLLMRFHWWRT